MLRNQRYWVGALTVAAIALFGASPVHAVNPKYFPPDTEIIFSFNFKQIINSKLFKKEKKLLERIKKQLEDNFPGGDQAQKYLKEAGIDIYKDIHSFSFGMPPRRDPEAGFFVIEGNFDAKKFHAVASKAALNNNNISVRKSGNITVLTITPPGQQRFFAALINSKALIACATKQALNEGLARATGIKRGGLKKDVLNLLKNTSPKQSISFVISGDAIKKMAQGQQFGGGQFGPGPDDIKGVSGNVTIAKSVKFRLGVRMTDGQTAQQTAQGATFGLKFFQGMMSDRAKDDERLQPAVDVMNTIKINAEGSTMFVQGNVPPATLQSLLKQLEKEF